MDSNIILYTSEGGDVSVQVQYEDGTFWLTQKRMAEFLPCKRLKSSGFGVNTNTINYHLKDLIQTTEIQEERTVRKIRIVQTEGRARVRSVPPEARHGVCL